MVEGGKVKTFTSTMALAERERVAAAAHAYQSQAPAGMPTTGQDQIPLLITVFAIGVLALVAGLYVGVRGQRSY